MASAAATGLARSPISSSWLFDPSPLVLARAGDERALAPWSWTAGTNQVVPECAESPQVGC